MMFRIHAIEDARPGRERLKIILSGRPRAQQRPRIGRVSNGNRPRVHFYNPSYQAQDQMKQVLQEVIMRDPNIHDDVTRRDGLFFFPEAAPLKAVIKFFMPRPKSHFRRNSLRSASNLTEAAVARRDHKYRPDLDNMAKFVIDC
jgi:hypothetical protein